MSTPTNTVVRGARHARLLEGFSRNARVPPISGECYRMACRRSPTPGTVCDAVHECTRCRRCRNTLRFRVEIITRYVNWAVPESRDYKVGPLLAGPRDEQSQRGRTMKNIALTVIAMAALGAMGTTPAYASGGGGSAGFAACRSLASSCVPHRPAVARVEPRSLSPPRWRSWAPAPVLHCWPAGAGPRNSSI